MRTALLFAIAAAALAADDGWEKVRALKSGAEIRIYKKGAVEPLIARFDEAADDRLSFVVKKEQAALAKDQVDRLDARPQPQKKGATLAGKNETRDPGGRDYSPQPQQRAPTPTTSTSTGVSFGGAKPDFETIYRRRKS